MPVEILPYDPDNRAFLNIKTIEELREAERVAREDAFLDQ
jgi:hypothetical protein